MKQSQQIVTPMILALTRRATLCGLPYNTFIGLLISGCVSFIWIDNFMITVTLVMLSYAFCSVLCHRDMWALDIFFMRLQLGVSPIAIKQYFNLRSYAAE